MIGFNVNKRISVLSSLVVVALAIVVVLLVTKTFASAESTDWPPFSMVYQIEGATVAVGSEPAQTLQEVHRLVYQSKTEWVDTVIESPDVETRVGIFSNVGSYQRLDGRDYIEFKAIDGSTSSEKVDEGVRRVPGAALVPYPIAVLKDAGIEFTKVATSANVCFLDVCKESAEGLMFVDNGLERVFADDSRGIPLRVGDSFFEVLELRIGDVKR